MESCVLCDEKSAVAFGAWDTRRQAPEKWGYLICETCGIVFRNPTERLSIEDEKSRYDLHENDPSDTGYQIFLRRLWEPLKQKCRPGGLGLDFGCGPTTPLSELAASDGFEIFSYDPIFFPDEELLGKNYDFIFCSEAIEHFYSPGQEFEMIFTQLLAEDGVLGVMTHMLTNLEIFPDWYYRVDPTHVSLYQPQTLRWLASKYKRDIEVIGDRVAIFI